MAEAQTQKKSLTAGEAAKMVRRPVTRAVMRNGEAVKDKDGNAVTTTDRVSVGADEVLAFRDYDTHVVVVTKDGQKFSSKGDE
jgi:hypothetical protein